MSNAQVQACASKCRNNFCSMKKSQPNSTVSISKTANRNGLSKFNFSQNLSQKNPIFFIFFVEHAIFFCWIVCQFVITDKEKVLWPIRTRQLLILVLYTKNASALNVTSWSDKIQNTTYTNEFIERPKLRACATKMISLSSYALISDTTPAAQKCT